MCVEAFDSSELFYHGKRFFHGSFVESHDAGPALELIGPQSREGTARPAGRQGVAGSGEEITDRHGGVIAEINGARRPDLREPAILILGDE